MPLDPFSSNALANATGNVLSDSFEVCANYVGRRLGLFDGLELEDYPKTLKEVADGLCALRDDNERKIKHNKTKTTSSCYNQWLSSVTKILLELEKLNAQCERGSNLLVDCLVGSKLREKVRTLCQRVENLVEEGKFVGGFLVDKPLEPTVRLRTPDIKEFPTLQERLDQILLFLCCDRVITIVIWGLPGLGKTTIMQNLNNHEKIAKMFQIIIWIKVKEVQTMENLQMDIARRLGINVEGTAGYSNEVAKWISEELKDKRYLLLLDDVRVEIDPEQLHAIGIPDKENGSKVVLTTEDRRVCFKMKLVQSVEVKKLTPDESWKMFKQIIADHKIDHGAFKSYAWRVANLCGGFPLVIEKVANYFKFKGRADEWRNGWEKLRKGSRAELSHLTQLHAFLKCCYDDLEDQQKRCFLYSALHPADTMISTDYLVKCWAAERLLGKIDEERTFRSACDEGYVMLRHLTDVSLLQASERLKHVQVDDMVQRVACHISSEDPHCKFVVGEAENSDHLNIVEDCQQVERIFLIDRKLTLLPDSISKCNRLLSLLLQKNPELKTIPPQFFNKMQNLLVLNLYKTGIQSLPPSSQYLTELKVLFLNGCTRLTDLPCQSRLLPLLEVLDIRGCKLSFIPTFIGELVHLRCLRISYYKACTVNGCEAKELDVVPRLPRLEIGCHVISKLYKLEELVIDLMHHDNGCIESYDQWCIEVTMVIQQVALLQNLASLEICFPKLENLQDLMESRLEWKGREQLASFWLFVGRPICNPPEIPACLVDSIERYLRYCYDEHDNASTTSNMFPEIDALELIGDHNRINCLSDFMQASGLNGVLSCLVEGCRNMVTIVDGNNAGGIDILPSLEHLHLKNLFSLTSIFKGPMSRGSLSQLHTLVVNRCLSLSEIFSGGQIQQCSNLRKLTIQSCYLCEKELIVDSNGGGSMKSLEVLELNDMPNLRTVSTSASLAWPQLREFRVFKCPDLKILPFNRENAAKLKLIEGEQLWWDDLSETNKEFKDHFQDNGILRLSR
ncbi:hypothetical protein SLE2022_204530 [Rubroshorea leprosula]